MKETIKYILDESRIPRYWYNIMAEMPIRRSEERRVGKEC